MQQAHAELLSARLAAQQSTSNHACTPADLNGNGFVCAFVCADPKLVCVRQKHDLIHAHAQSEPCSHECVCAGADLEPVLADLNLTIA